MEARLRKVSVGGRHSGRKGHGRETGGVIRKRPGARGLRESELPGCVGILRYGAEAGLIRGPRGFERFLCGGHEPFRAVHAAGRAEVVVIGGPDIAGGVEAIMFAMGIGGMFSASLVYPGAGLLSGMAHAGSLSIATVASVLTWSVCMRGTTSSPRVAESPTPVSIGLSALASLIVAALTVPAQAVVMTIATMTTILAQQTSAGSPTLGQRTARAAAGVLASAAFLAIVSGSGNNLAVFLAAMAIVIGAFEWFASSIPAKGTLFWLAAAIFAVAAGFFLFLSERRNGMTRQDQS